MGEPQGMQKAAMDFEAVASLTVFVRGAPGMLAK